MKSSATLALLLASLTISACAMPTVRETAPESPAHPTRPVDFSIDASLETQVSLDPMHGRVVLRRKAPNGAILDEECLGYTRIDPNTLKVQFRAAATGNYVDIPNTGSKTWQRRFGACDETWQLDWTALRSHAFDLAFAMLQDGAVLRSRPLTDTVHCSKRVGRFSGRTFFELHDRSGLCFRQFTLPGNARRISLWQDARRLAELEIRDAKILEQWALQPRPRSPVRFLPCGVGAWPGMTADGRPPELREADEVRRVLLWFDYIVNDRGEVDKGANRRLFEAVMTGRYWTTVLPVR